MVFTLYDGCMVYARDACPMRLRVLIVHFENGNLRGYLHNMVWKAEIADIFIRIDHRQYRNNLQQLERENNLYTFLYNVIMIQTGIFAFSN